MEIEQIIKPKTQKLRTKVKSKTSKRRKVTNLVNKLADMTMNGKAKIAKRKPLKMRKMKTKNLRSNVQIANQNYGSSVRAHYMNLLDPWNASEARLPRVFDTYTNTAKVHNAFNLQSNASGNLLIYFDADYVNANGNTNTTFFYNNDATLVGNAPLATSTYKSGAAASVPTPPATTVLKTRLVSAAIKATVKLSALNNVGTIYTCIDYGDYAVQAQSASGLAVSTNIQNYANFANILSSNGGKKIDIIGDVASIYMNWYPVDPFAEVFIDPGSELLDSNSSEVGGDPRFVMGFESLNNGASTKVEFEIVWNIEYLANPIAKPWLGAGSFGINSTDHTLILDGIKNNSQSSMTESEKRKADSFDSFFANNMTRSTK